MAGEVLTIAYTALHLVGAEFSAVVDCALEIQRVAEGSIRVEAARLG